MSQGHSSFSRVLCTTCNEDTLHKYGKCLTCGTVFMTPTQHRKQANGRLYGYNKKGKKLPRGVSQAKYSNMVVRLAAEKRKYQERTGNREQDHKAVRGTFSS